MGRNILVVEDDKNISDLIHMYLVKEGFDVRIAGDGGKALEEFQKKEPDLPGAAGSGAARYHAACDGRLGGLRQDPGDQQGAHHHADGQERGL